MTASIFWRVNLCIKGSGIQFSRCALMAAIRAAVAASWRLLSQPALITVNPARRRSRMICRSALWPQSIRCRPLTVTMIMSVSRICWFVSFILVPFLP